MNWLLNFLNCLTENAPRFGIAQEKYADIELQVDAYRLAHEKAVHPNAGKADRLNRKEKAESVRRAVRRFVNEYLRYNSAVKDEDRVNLGLHVPDTKPTAVARPKTCPSVYVRSAGPRQLRLVWHDAGTVSKVKPAGVHGCEIRWAILDEHPTANGDLTCSEFCTRSSYVFAFDEAQRSKTVYFCLRWENTRGEKGPWSEIIHAVIP
jgi:hypothetical protein